MVTYIITRVSFFIWTFRCLCQIYEPKCTWQQCNMPAPNLDEKLITPPTLMFCSVNNHLATVCSVHVFPTDVRREILSLHYKVLPCYLTTCVCVCVRVSFIIYTHNITDLLYVRSCVCVCVVSYFLPFRLSTDRIYVCNYVYWRCVLHAWIRCEIGDIWS